MSLASSRAGPVLVALGLGLLSVPLVAWSLTVEPSARALANGPLDERIDGCRWRRSMRCCWRWSSSSRPRSSPGGSAGVAWRRWRLVGVAVAISLGWALGIVLLPIAASLLGIHLRAGITCTALTFCQATLRDDELLSGATAYVELVAGVLLLMSAPVVPLIPIAALWLGRRAGRFVVPVLAVIGGHAIIHWIAIANQDPSAVVAYACLAVGVLLWALWLRRQAPPPDSPVATHRSRRAPRPRDHVDRSVSQVVVRPRGGHAPVPAVRG